MRFKNFLINERIYDTDIEIVDKEIFKGKISYYEGTITLNSLLLILNKSPNEWIKNPDFYGVYRLIIPGFKSNKLLIRYGHSFPHNKGSILLKSNKKVTITVSTMKLDKNVMTLGNILKIEDKEVSPENVLNTLFKYFKDYKIVTDFEKNKIGEVPEIVQKFINNYVAMGGQNAPGSGKNWRKIMKWYQSLPDKLKNPIPKFVYRGIESDKEIGDIYKHPYKYPISTSTSRKIAKDFGKSIKIQIKPENVVLDTRILMTDHPAQNEIILDPTKEYKIN